MMKEIVHICSEAHSHTVPIVPSIRLSKESRPLPVTVPFPRNASTINDSFSNISEMTATFVGIEMSSLPDSHGEPTVTSIEQRRVNL